MAGDGQLRNPTSSEYCLGRSQRFVEGNGALLLGCVQNTTWVAGVVVLFGLFSLGSFLMTAPKTHQCCVGCQSAKQNCEVCGVWCAGQGEF